MKKLLLVIPFLLVACDASHDVEWYKKHEKERKATIQVKILFTQRHIPATVE